MTVKELKKKIPALALKLGLECPDIDGMDKSGLQEVFDDMNQQLDSYVVAEKVTIKCKAGLLKSGQDVKPEYFENGQNDMSVHIANGSVAKK